MNHAKSAKIATNGSGNFPTEEDKIARSILDHFFQIHTELGPGLLESVYEKVLAHRLGKAGWKVKTQVPVPILIDNLEFPEGFRADLIVNDLVLVELKSTEEIKKVFAKQLLTYLRLSKLKLGLLINFGSSHLKDGIERVANGL